MATISHEPSEAVPAGQRAGARLPLRDMWASLAIGVMWLAVAFAAMFGPDIVSSSPGNGTTTIPSAAVVALFAYLGTRVVARYGLGRERTPSD
jgi:hypothetical protein